MSVIDKVIGAVTPPESDASRAKARAKARAAAGGDDWLARIIAEEAVIYPAMALTDQKAHSESAYVEQSAAKVQIAALDDLEPMSQDYLDKLEHVRGAVAHHVYEEEDKFFPKLKDDADPAMQGKLTRRYSEEFDRYMGADAD